MSQQVNAHTPASLRAMHADDPRKLDALAAEVVMGQRVKWVELEYADGERESRPIVLDVGTLPDYSASLDAAAMLEQRLAERDILLEHVYALRLVHLLNVRLIDYDGVPDWYSMSSMIRASALDRTIAAILAAQEATNEN